MCNTIIQLLLITVYEYPNIYIYIYAFRAS